MLSTTTCIRRYWLILSKICTKRRWYSPCNTPHIYDISTESYGGWIWYGLTGLAALYSFGMFTERKPDTYPQRYWVMGFGLVVAVRINYLTDKHIDAGSLENRVLKFQIRP